MSTFIKYLGLVLLTACQQFTPPDAVLLASLATAEASPTRQVSDCAIESKAISGEFRAAIVSSGDINNRVRLQLFPDFGGKILDLIATPTGIHADWPFLPDGRQADEVQVLADAIGISLLESVTPLRPDRILGMAPCAAGYRLLVAPVYAHPELEVQVTVTTEGQVVQRSYRFGRVAWTEHCGEVRRLIAPRFSWTITSSIVEQLQSVPEALFHRTMS